MYFIECFWKTVFQFQYFHPHQKETFSIIPRQTIFSFTPILSISIGQWVIILAACILFYLMDFFLFQNKSISHITFCYWFVLLCHQLSHHLWLLISSSQTCSRGERGKAEPTLAGAEETALLNSPLRTYHSVIQPAPSRHIPESAVASEVA